MALVLANRVKETSTTTGTGTLSLAGAVTGFQTFVDGIGTTNTTYYSITDESGNFEVGLGTVTDGTPDTLSRDTVLESSNSGSKVDFGSGTKTIFVTQPAEKAVYQDSSCNVSLPNCLTVDTHIDAGQCVKVNSSGSFGSSGIDFTQNNVTGTAAFFRYIPFYGFSLVGDCNLGLCSNPSYYQYAFNKSGLSFPVCANMFFEGCTTNSNELTVSYVDPTADQTVKFPDKTGTLMIDVADDTSPTLGGNLDVGGNDIVSSSNGNIDISPNGTGDVNLCAANTCAYGDFSSCGDVAGNTGQFGKFIFNGCQLSFSTTSTICTSAYGNKVFCSSVGRVIIPPTSSGGTGGLTLCSGTSLCMNDYALPTSDGSAGQFLCTNGSGTLSFVNRGDNVCVVTGNLDGLNSALLNLCDTWKELEIAIQSDCRTLVCYYPTEPKIDNVMLRHCAGFVRFDYKTTTTNNTTGLRQCSNTCDLMPDIYIGCDTVLKYHFWKVCKGSGPTCNKILMEASYQGGCHAYTGTGRCDGVIITGRSDTTIYDGYSCWQFCITAGSHFAYQYYTGGTNCVLLFPQFRCSKYVIKTVS